MMQKKDEGRKGTKNSFISFLSRESLVVSRIMFSAIQIFIEVIIFVRESPISDDCCSFQHRAVNFR